MMSEKKMVSRMLLSWCFIVFFIILSVLSPTCLSRQLQANVHIQNKLPSELKFHCKTKGNDLGTKTIAKGAEFKWKFGLHVVGNTLYSCTFDWGKKHAALDVFSEDLAKKNCPNYHCVWVVKPDGFYMGNKKLQDWK